MKLSPLGIFKILSVLVISIIIIIIVIPIDLFDMEQAQRIAKWKSTYEKLEYSMNLVKMHEGSIIPSSIEAGKLVDENYILSRFSPYLNLESAPVFSSYKYKKMNGRRISKSSQFNFNKFIKRKDGVILGIKKNLINSADEKLPLYIMFVDINGDKKPNKIGKDIFFINIFKNNISAMGKGKTHSQLNVNCSPIGGGYFCSEYYLLGGKF